MLPDDDHMPPSPDLALDRVKQERERLMEQIVRSEKAIEESRKLILHINRLLSSEKELETHRVPEPAIIR